VRETLEETAWRFEPQALLGVYVWRPEHQHRTFLRVAFAGAVSDHDPSRPLDRGILRTRWLTREQLAETRTRLRSPLVTQCVDDYLAGTRHPLSLISHLIAAPVSLAASG
jgi:8-oxo-dGTP pyrophosphatase MutT (NUDIX family)